MSSYHYLQMKKRMNVGDFVDARRAAMENLARTFTSGQAFPERVYDLLHTEELGPDKAILVSYSAEPVCCKDHFAGLVLTHDRRFFEFDIELGSGNRVDVNDVTDSTDTRARIPAIGTSDGHLALCLLEKLMSQGRINEGQP
jgi:hypothetical protein